MLHPRENGDPVEQDKILERLNREVARELITMMRYLLQSLMVFGFQRGAAVSFLREQVEESMQHAIRLGEKLVALGGTPSIKFSEVYEPKPVPLEELLHEALEAEQEGLDDLMEFHSWLDADNDIPLKHLIEGIISEEAKQVDEIQKYLKQVDGKEGLMLE